MLNPLRKSLLLCCAAAALASCGGGGDDPPQPPPNRAPVLVTTALAATEDAALNAQLVATDADANALTFARVTDVQHGTLTVSTSGAVVYTPTANYAGADSFSVRVTDGAGGETTGTVNINVAAVNDAPAFTNTTFNATEDTALDVNLVPTDIDNGTLTVTRTSAPQHGQATVSTAGLVNYLPSANYFGADSFGVSVSDGAGGTTNATVTINVAAVNDTPVLTTTAFSVNEDGTLAGQLLADDVEAQALTYSLGDSTTHGQVSVAANGVITYTPDANYFGTDALTVRVSDNPPEVTTWNVTITVNSVNDIPVATDDEFRISDGAPKTMVVVTNDTDVEQGTLTVSIVQQPSGGTVTVGANNLLTFTSANAFAGPVSFTYRLTDSDGGHDDATVRAVIGTFPGLVYLSDELTPGRREIFLFDGLRSTRIVQAPAFDWQFITRFTISDDGTRLLYVVADALVDSFYFKPLNAQGQGVKIWENQPQGSPNVNAGTRLQLNRTGTQALIEDRYSTNAKNIYIVDTASSAATLLGGNVPSVVRASIALFNPQNENQVVLQGQVGGTVPTNGAESYSAFVASVNNAGQLTQLGANYPQNQGNGSGFGFWFGGAGRYLYHTEYLPTATPSTKSLLMYDMNTTTESVVYRRPVGTERGLTSLPSTNPDGRIAFSFTEPNPSDGDGPAAFYVASPNAPSTATPLSLPYRRAGTNWMTSDGNTLVFLATPTGAGAKQEVYSVGTSSPASLPTKLNRAFNTNEDLGGIYIARGAQRMLIGYLTPPSVAPMLYSHNINGAPGSEFLVTAALPANGILGPTLDDHGLMLAYTSSEGSRNALYILSTQTLNYSIPITGSTGTYGVAQYRWLPKP